MTSARSRYGKANGTAIAPGMRTRENGDGVKRPAYLPVWIAFGRMVDQALIKTQTPRKYLERALGMSKGHLANVLVGGVAMSKAKIERCVRLLAGLTQEQRRIIGLVGWLGHCPDPVVEALRSKDKALDRAIVKALS